MQDGEAYEAPVARDLSHIEIKPVRVTIEETVSLWCAVKPVWRDLPMVSAEEAKQDSTT